MKLHLHTTRFWGWSLWLFASFSFLQAQVPHPKDVFGFTPGDDYQLATYSQFQDYFQKLDEASDRVMMREIGKSVLGKPMMLLFISSEENLKQLEKWRTTSEQLARARIDDETAQKLAAEGKTIVWVDGGLHATEVAGAQMTPLLAHRVATEETAEMQKIRENTIMLLMPVMNPDGLDIVASWYRQNRGTPFETTRPPWLYHFYIGHDNNRDWFMNNMPESKAVTNTLYNEWYPQIVYNHHQTGPSWTRIFVPPFADPVNPNIHPGVTTGVNMVGSAMSNRFALKHMPGIVSGVIYSMWWNGGMRTVPYFHNMIGLLTETSHASPTPRFYDPDSMPRSIGARRGASGLLTNGTNIFYPDPWKGGMSTFSQPVSYMITATMAVLRIAADRREEWLYNIYRMGRDAIEGTRLEAPYAYIIPPDQWNAGEEIALINILQIGGIEIQQANTAFEAGEKSYPAGSYIIRTDQAFRPYLLDLLEKQEYPHRTRNGQPETPYDLAGWTLPMQMGVQIERAEETFEVNSSAIAGQIRVKAGEISGKVGFGYAFSHRPNASTLVLNRLLKDGKSVYLDNSGQYIVEGKGKSMNEKLASLTKSTGINFQAVSKKPASGMTTLKAGKIAIYKSWVANMDEGWTRWLLNTYEFDLDTLHDADVREKDLSIYDAIIIPSQSANRILNGHMQGTMPEPYTGGIGLEGTFALKNYVNNGGRIVALDAASDFLIEQFGLPVRNAVSGVSARSFFIPGSLIKIEVDTTHKLAFGMEAEAAAYFVRSRAFEVVRLSRKQEGGMTQIEESARPEVEVIAHYPKKDLLMSGWAMGEHSNLGGKAAMVRIPVGSGDVVLFGFRPQFRGQPRATYKLFFNSLLYK